MDAFSLNILGGDVVQRAVLEGVVNDIDGMRRVRCDQSQCGLISVDDAGNAGLLARRQGS